MSLVLVTDATGAPKDWVNFEVAAAYYARDKVLWEVGKKLKKFHGGINAISGTQSQIEISSILGVSGPVFGDDYFKRESIYADRGILYGRDRYMCAYCGNIFEGKSLTIDHVQPKSKGGKNTWTNCVSACKTCNVRKGNRTPEQAKMPLLYVPYSPNAFEKMILSNRKILVDQMEFLMARVPKNSRVRLQS